MCCKVVRGLVPQPGEVMNIPKRRGDLTREQYILSLSPEQLQALRFVELVKLCIRRYVIFKLEKTISLETRQIEEIVVAVAKKFGYVSDLFKIDCNGNCPAVMMMYDDRMYDAGKKTVHTFSHVKSDLTFLESRPEAGRVVEFADMVLPQFLSKL